GESVLVGCKGVDKEAPPLWIYDREGGHDLRVRGPGGLRVRYNRSCFGDGGSGGTPMCVDIEQGLRVSSPRDDGQHRYWPVSRDRCLVQEGDTLWFAGRFGAGERTRVALPAALDPCKVPLFQLMTRPPLVLLGPLVFDADTGALLGFVPGAHVAFRRDGS